MDPNPEGLRQGGPSRIWLMGAVVAVMLLVQMPRVVQRWREAPDGRQRIAALLVSWGCRPPGLTLPVEEAQVRRRVESLGSPDGEERVRAARWLAEHGVREAAPEIAAAMWDPGTVRPCQLAHSLGGLGDAQAVEDLLGAANQAGNTDLRVCALFALRDLACEDAVEGLLALCDDPFTANLAVEALGEVADRRALARLGRLLRESDDAALRRAAMIAVERIEVVSGDDPAPGLLRRVEGGAARGEVDAWAVRRLARARDERAVGPLAAVMVEKRLGGRECELLAAALLAHGATGAEALRRIAGGQGETEARRSAQRALGLIEPGRALCLADPR